MVSFLRTILADCLKACGDPDAEKKATKALEALAKVEPVRTALENVDRDAEAYRLAGIMPVRLVAKRIGLAPKNVYAAIERHKRNKRIA